MGKHKSEAKKASQDADHLNSLRNINVRNEKELNAFKLKFNPFFSGDFQEVIRYLSNIAVEHHDLHQVLKSVNSRIKEHKSTGTSSNATHRQKRSLEAKRSACAAKSYALVQRVIEFHNVLVENEATFFGRPNLAH
ncbi:hypothetical protein B0H16DRAFT_1475685 [Mycena metata]|uniref:Uncharacterized protein n=1 Tax=Mycena metata TaxID=1033252 RepID=A0AAD7HDI3_9AGAR|nr:hypothetical protein B0H16DRAFT_1475685 [Mycena metata]